MILQHTERHLAYPVLHYFHSTTPKYSAPLTFTILDEAISIQETFEIDRSPNAISWQILRETMDSYLEVFEKFNATSKEAEPLFPYHDGISNLPVNKSQQEVDNTVSELADRRKKLHGMIMRDGWKWVELQK